MPNVITTRGFQLLAGAGALGILLTAMPVQALDEFATPKVIVPTSKMLFVPPSAMKVTSSGSAAAFFGTLPKPAAPPTNAGPKIPSGSAVASAAGNGKVGAISGGAIGGSSVKSAVGPQPDGNVGFKPPRVDPDPRPIPTSTGGSAGNLGQLQSVASLIQIMLPTRATAAVPLESRRQTSFSKLENRLPTVLGAPGATSVTASFANGAGFASTPTTRAAAMQTLDAARSLI